MALTVDNATAARRAEITLGLTAQNVEERRHYIGASDANVILGGDSEKILRLWQIKRGEAEPDDLSDVLPVQLGTWTEDFNALWFERQTGLRVTDRNIQIEHPVYSFIRAQSDGHTQLETGQRATWEAKHVSAFNFDLDRVTARYMPQIAVQMACSRTEYAVLSVLSGTTTWEWRIIERDELYEAQVLSELNRFWQCVQDGTPPTTIVTIEPPLPHELMRTVSMANDPEWLANEDVYVSNQKAAKDFEGAKKALKDLVEGDVKEAIGEQVTIRRSKTGALSVVKTKKK